MTLRTHTAPGTVRHLTNVICLISPLGPQFFTGNLNSSGTYWKPVCWRLILLTLESRLLSWNYHLLLTQLRSRASYLTFLPSTLPTYEMWTVVDYTAQNLLNKVEKAQSLTRSNVVDIQ